MKLIDRLLDDLADRIADRLLDATTEPDALYNHSALQPLGDDRYTDFERSLLAPQHVDRAM